MLHIAAVHNDTSILSTVCSQYYVLCSSAVVAVRVDSVSYLKSRCLGRTLTISQSGLATRGAASPDVAGIIHVHVDVVVHF